RHVKKRHQHHLSEQNIKQRTIGYHHQEMPPELLLAAPASVMNLLDVAAVNDKRVGLKRRPVLPFDTFNMGHYKVTALKATHIPSIGDAVNYIIDDGNKKVLIASDTAVYEEDVWPYLKNAEWDQLVIECDVSVNTHLEAAQTRHVSINCVQMMIDKMKEINAITHHTSIYVSHFTHKHCLPHDEMNEIFKDLGAP